MLKAGLVNEKKFKKVTKGAKKSRVQSREVKAAVEEQKRQQQERDKELNTQKNEARLSKEIQSQVKQLIELNKLNTKDGDIKYNFTDGTLVKSLYVTSLLREQLIKGIVRLPATKTLMWSFLAVWRTKLPNVMSKPSLNSRLRPVMRWMKMIHTQISSCRMT